MPNIIEIADKETLIALKEELASKINTPEKVIEKFKNQYEEKSYDEYTCHINFGYERNINNFKSDVENIKPYSNVQNYPKIMEARGKWQDIYNIAFASGKPITINAKIKKEKVKQIIKEAA